MNRIFAYIIFSLFLFLFSGSLYAEGLIGNLSRAQSVNIALLNNIQIKIAKLNQDISLLDLDIETSIFDTEAWFDINWKQDKRTTGSTLTGSRIKDQNYNFGVTKRIPTGADIKATVYKQDLDTNSPFIVPDPASITEMEFSITQPLLKNIGGIQDKSPIRIAEIEIDRISLEARETIETVIADVEKAYWDLVLAVESLKAHKEILQKAQEFLLLNIENRKSGLVEDVDVYAAEANVERHITRFIVAENMLQTAIEKLKLEMNYPHYSRIVPTEKLVYSEVILDANSILTSAVKNRRDYLKKLREIDQSDVTLKMKKNSRWPQLDLIATFNANGIDNSYFDSLAETAVSENPSYFLGVEFSFPFANTKARAEAEEAKLDKAVLILDLRQLEADIAFEIDDKVRAVQTNTKKAAKIIRIEEIESKKLDEEERNYRLGRSSSNVLIDYQDDLIEARLAKIESIVDLEKSLVDLERARNTLLSKYLPAAH